MPQIEAEGTLRAYFPFGFPMAKKAWDRYGVAELVDPDESISVVDDIFRLRKLALKVNEQRLRATYQQEPVHAGQLVTVALIVDILRFVAQRYCHEQEPRVLARGFSAAERQRGAAVVDQPPLAFVEFFPPQKLIKGQGASEAFLDEETVIFNDAQAPNREVVATEMILLALAAANPAFAPFRELFDDEALRRSAPYRPLVDSLEEFFATQPPVDEIGETLLTALRAPMMEDPHSLEGQLEFLRTKWADLLPAGLVQRVTVARNILNEETTQRGFGPPELRVMEFGKSIWGQKLDAEPAAFTRDADWMPNVVLLAKSTYVWLDQLTKEFGRPITTLADIPDEELDRLAGWGFTGLWLIGLWERSAASRTIKNWMGNPEAVASAYSLYDYAIAADLGGEEAYQDLRERAWRRGIRLASDMVPNHVGIFSRWVVEHPDWFVQSEQPPFPSYSFSGGNLSEDDRVALFIEDGYWDKRDAAVVFKRVDTQTGHTRYLYHGNDGTNMPWNDTAQLNFLIPEVREAVVQTVLHVARKFPIIRFDAAMTLAKRHFQRLWFPEPGDGGAIPSRAEHGMTKAQFEEVFSKEFWREVVDRVQAEVPDTLLLAEAFWLMEGYFVRTLGMHRVYNSAFMNMLKMEDNGKYRQTVRNVLEFSPEVLMRFVNFMNNPDEDTAIAQFGDGDKYFGVAVMMVTMPGLPMFGHGQVQGFTEKYGMEYRRAYWDETPRSHLIARHEHEVFPLMRRRALFSGVANFALYDFVTPEGAVDENVFAYSNRAGDERALILFNNAFNTTTGRVTTSTPINVADSEHPNLQRLSLGDALALKRDDDVYYAFRDHRTKRQFLRHGRQLAEQGFSAYLTGYDYVALVDFREIRDEDGWWARLAERLGESNVVDLDVAYRTLKLEPVLLPVRRAINGPMLREVLFADDQKDVEGLEHMGLQRFAEAGAIMLAAAKEFAGADGEVQPVQARFDTAIAHIADLAAQVVAAKLGRRAEMLTKPLANKKEPLRHVLVGWQVARALGEWRAADDTATTRETADRRFDQWLVGRALADAFADFRMTPEEGRRDGLLARVLVAHDTLLQGEDKTPGEAWEELTADENARAYLQVNEHDGVMYFHQESLERLIDALLLATATELLVEGKLKMVTIAPAVEWGDRLRAAAKSAGYALAKTGRLL
jgi:glycosidase